MKPQPDVLPSSEGGATVVITHRVRDDQQVSYEAWLQQIEPICRSAPGHLDWQLIRPITGLTATYTVVIRFATHSHLQAWLHSPERRQLIDHVRPLLVTGDDFFIRSGLDFWFTPEGARARVPVLWKQALVTWSAIYPLQLGVPLLVLPLLRLVGLSPDRFLDTLAISAVITGSMVYLIMPNYTRLIQRWLFA